MSYDSQGNPIEKYHLVFCDHENKVFSWLSFYYKSDQQFFMLDKAGDFVHHLLEMIGLIEKYPNYTADWSRDIQVHELTYYKSKSERNDDPICTVYFFTDEYMSDWYFKEHFGFLTIDVRN